MITKCPMDVGLIQDQTRVHSGQMPERRGRREVLFMRENSLRQGHG